jgi:aerobic-type carbon monoxide dehydrogenase small subunit (CoxS/CutS family)
MESEEMLIEVVNVNGDLVTKETGCGHIECGLLTVNIDLTL